MKSEKAARIIQQQFKMKKHKKNFKMIINEFSNKIKYYQEITKENSNQLSQLQAKDMARSKSLKHEGLNKSQILEKPAFYDRPVL